MNDAKFVVITPDAEKTMTYIARVSNPAGQDNDDIVKLLKYCIKHQHWSVFEHASMTVEINTSIPIATQLIRHWGFRFQQFSQRYADPSVLGEIPVPELRRQDDKNRQNSFDDLDPAVVEKMKALIQEHFDSAVMLYRFLLSKGVAKECARFVLPEATPTRLYMTGRIREWIHYINLRATPETQKEHRVIAEAVKVIFREKLPVVSEALGWQ